MTTMMIAMKPTGEVMVTPDGVLVFVFSGKLFLDDEVQVGGEPFAVLVAGTAFPTDLDDHMEKTAELGRILDKAFPDIPNHEVRGQVMAPDGMGGHRPLSEN